MAKRLRLPEPPEDAPLWWRDLRAVRQRYGYSQAEIADALQVSERQVRRWEAQESEPHPSFAAVFREMLQDAA